MSTSTRKLFVFIRNKKKNCYSLVAVQELHEDTGIYNTSADIHLKMHPPGYTWRARHWAAYRMSFFGMPLVHHRSEFEQSLLPSPPPIPPLPSSLQGSDQLQPRISTPTSTPLRHRSWGQAQQHTRLWGWPRSEKRISRSWPAATDYISDWKVPDIGRRWERRWCQPQVCRETARCLSTAQKRCSLLPSGVQTGLAHGRGRILKVKK